MQDTKEEIQQHNDLLEWVKDQSLKAGASDVVVTLNENKLTRVEVRKGEIEKIKNGQNRSLSLSVYIDGKFARHSTNKTDRDALRSFIAEAVVATRFIQPDEFRQLPNPALYAAPSEDNLDRFDAVVPELTPEILVDKAMEAYPVVAERNTDFVSASSKLSASAGRSSRLHSNGFWGTYQHSSVSVHTDVSLRGAGDQRFEEYAAWYGTFWGDMPDVNALASDALERTIETQGQAKIASGKYQLILENRIATKFFGILMGAMSAASLYQKRSFLEGKVGELILPEFLSLQDVAYLPKGVGNCSYDDEGLAIKDRYLVKDGRFVDWLTSNYYGLKMNRPINGASTNNLILEAQPQAVLPVADLLSRAESAIWVKSFNGGNSNPVTGDFSFGISGQLIEQGQRIKPISEMVITGNVLDLFANLSAIGNDPYLQSSFRRPTLVFDNVQCSGI